MITLRRTSSSDTDFIYLVHRLDLDLKGRDGEELHEFYNQFNSVAKINHCVVAYESDIPVGCGGIKKFKYRSMEIKRMYLLPKYRGRGIASQILSELEDWAKELGCSACVLETGFNQPEAIALYKKTGYQIIDNYGQYEGLENSICFGKTLPPH